MSKGESERELRSKPRIDYSALHSHGIGRGTSPGGFTGIEFDQDVDQDVELDYGEDENASQFGDAGDELTLGGGQETSSMQPSNSITGPQKTYVSTSMEMAEEMGKLEQQMQRLDEEEALLRQSQKLQEMKKTVEEKKQKVSKLRGMSSVVEKTGEKTVKMTTNAGLTKERGCMQSNRQIIKFYKVL